MSKIQTLRNHRSDLVLLSDNVINKRIALKKGRELAFNIVESIENELSPKWIDTNLDSDYFIESSLSDILAMAISKRRLVFEVWAWDAYDKINMAMDAI